MACFVSCVNETHILCAALMLFHYYQGFRGVNTERFGLDFHSLGSDPNSESNLTLFLYTTEKPILRWYFLPSSVMVFSRSIWDLKWLLTTRACEGWFAIQNIHSLPPQQPYFYPTHSQEYCSANRTTHQRQTLKVAEKVDKVIPIYHSQKKVLDTMIHVCK